MQSVMSSQFFIQQDALAGGDLDFLRILGSQVENLLFSLYSFVMLYTLILCSLCRNFGHSCQMFLTLSAPRICLMHQEQTAVSYQDGQELWKIDICSRKSPRKGWSHPMVSSNALNCCSFFSFCDFFVEHRYSRGLKLFACFKSCARYSPSRLQIKPSLSYSQPSSLSPSLLVHFTNFLSNVTRSWCKLVKEIERSEFSKNRGSKIL